MAAKKPAISEADKSIVLRAFDSMMHPDIGLTSTQVGWKCNKSGQAWAESILEVLLIEKRVVKDTELGTWRPR
jgi:hypothetical protein